jgi:sporulation protein YlmC with PRC-barrel domain
MTAILGLAVASTSAQTQSSSTSTTYVQTSKFVGTKVKSSQREEIGTIKDVVIDRTTGCIAYTVLSTAGGTRVSSGGKLVAVPWAVYSPTAEVSALTVTIDRDRIYNAPVFDYSRIDEYSRSDYVSTVDSYYGVSQGAAAGAAVSGTTTRGAAARAGAASSPGATASPGATRSPAASPSPAAARSPGGNAFARQSTESARYGSRNSAGHPGGKTTRFSPWPSWSSRDSIH